MEYVAFNGLRQFRRPHLAAFLIAYGASFSSLKTRHGCGPYRVMPLLKHELTSGTRDCIILRAIIKTLARLPTLDEMGINADNPLRLAIPPLDAMSDVLTVHRGAFVQRCRWYQSLASSPRTLQHHCRVVVRNCLGPFRLRSVSSLPLPVPLRDYLLLEYDEYR